MYVRLSVCVSLASDSSETIEVIIIKTSWHGNCLRHGNASSVNYIDLDLQGHTDLNHENDKYSIISETFQAIPIKCAVKIVQLKV